MWLRTELQIRRESVLTSMVSYQSPCFERAFTWLHSIYNVHTPFVKRIKNNRQWSAHYPPFLGVLFFAVTCHWEAACSTEHQWKRSEIVTPVKRMGKDRLRWFHFQKWKEASQFRTALGPTELPTERNHFLGSAAGTRRSVRISKACSVISTPLYISSAWN
jgi:hypothetical protein